ncbi:MAG: potassium channel family protein, partial [Acutalibacteraceae bacterium]
MKQIAVLGLSRFGVSVARALEKLGVEVLGVDFDERLVNDYADELTHAVQADITDPDALEELNLKEFDAVVLSIREVESSCLAAITLKDHGVKRIVAQASGDAHAEILGRIGVDQVILPERDMGARLARRLALNNVADYMDLSDKYGIMEIRTPAPWAGKTLMECDPRNRYGINVLAVRAPNGEMIAPRADTCPRADDTLILMGTHADLAKV